MFWRAKKIAGAKGEGSHAEHIASRGEPWEPPVNDVMSPRNSDSLTPTVSGGKEEGLARCIETAAVSQRPFVVPSSYSVSGQLFTSRPVVLQGILEEGELVAPVAVILSGGRLRVPTRVDVLKVCGGGEVCRDVKARHRVEVLEQGMIRRGSIETPELSVAPGAFVAGVSLLVGPSRVG